MVFLESGSLCYSNETCNRRYFRSHIRERYSTDIRGQNAFGNFDTVVAWAETAAAGQRLSSVVNPLMTSPYCFRNETQFFSDSDSLSVEGRDILSSDCRENPTFYNHGRVVWGVINAKILSLKFESLLPIFDTTLYFVLTLNLI